MDTTLRPYSGVVSIVSEFSNINPSIGSGALIAPNKVLTANHVIYDSDYGSGYATRITVYPGRNGDSLPFSGVSVVKYEPLGNFTSLYPKGAWYEEDLAVLTLSAPIGLETGYFNPASFTGNEGTLETAGYPGDKGGATMYKTSGKVTSLSDRTGLTQIDIMKGQSGSPVFDKNRNVVGVIVGEDKSVNVITKITPQTLTKIKNSINADYVQDRGHALYRLYNPNTGLHFYTNKASERDHLVRVGWRSEGTAWTYPTNGGVPVYRLYNPNQGTHHFTVNTYEKDNLVRLGWRYEGIAFYSGGDLNVYRMYNPNSGEHFYTLSTGERDHLVKVGWKYEGVGFKAQNK